MPVDEKRKLSKWRLSGKIRHYYINDQHTCTACMVCTQHHCLWKCSWSIEIYHGKVCTETFVDYIECKPMTELTDTFEREYKAAEKYLSVLKTLRIEREANTVITWIYI